MTLEEKIKVTTSPVGDVAQGYRPLTDDKDYRWPVGEVVYFSFEGGTTYKHVFSSNAIPSDVFKTWE